MQHPHRNSGQVIVHDETPIRVIVCDAVAGLYSRKGIARGRGAGELREVRREGERRRGGRGRGGEAEAGAGTRAETGTPVSKNKYHIILFLPPHPVPTAVVISFLICSRYKRAHATSSYGA